MTLFNSTMFSLLLCGICASILHAAQLHAADVGAHRQHMPYMDPATAAESIDATRHWKINPGFELLDQNGDSVTLADFKGKYLLVTFGFTHCEHICPLMAATMGAVLNKLAAPAAGIFISVDTERDSPALTTAYAQVFSSKMTGLGGDFSLVNAAAANFGVSYAVNKTRESYSVQHTANIFLLDPAGALLDIFPLNATVEDILDKIKEAG